MAFNYLDDERGQREKWTFQYTGAELAPRARAKAVALLAEERSIEQALADCQLLRDIVGNPFRPAVIDPAWLSWNDGLVQRLARRIYDERACDLYPILGDALEDARRTAGGPGAVPLAYCGQRRLPCQPG